MARKPNITNIKILIADSDSNLGLVLTNVLQRMGFKYVQYVKDGASAKKALEQEHKDILITEWHMQSIDGIELTNIIRNSAESSLRLLPIIMLTARAEKQDVEAARDAGITEFVVKPYNSLTVFQRIQQVIDNPRGFLMAPKYVGPDRRRKGILSPEMEERRKESPEIVNHTNADNVNEDTPKLIPPDYVLKKRIGIYDTLDSIITLQLLEDAQKVINDLKDESLNRIKIYVKEVDKCYKLLINQPGNEPIEKLKESLLAIKANAGTFGYKTASEVAHQLYQFIRFNYSLSSVKHNHVLLKHIQSLKILLGTMAEGKALEKETQLLQGLKMMIAKFQDDRA